MPSPPTRSSYQFAASSMSDAAGGSRTSSNRSGTRISPVPKLALQAVSNFGPGGPFIGIGFQLGEAAFELFALFIRQRKHVETGCRINAVPEILGQLKSLGRAQLRKIK